MKITKEDLLQKGMSEADADEIISKLETEDELDSLQALEKALSNDDKTTVVDDQNLNKADDGGGDDDEGDKDSDDDEKMMKYMKSKGKARCQKMMKKLGYSSEKMQKAIDDIDLESEGAVVEMNDLAPFLEAQANIFDEMIKAIGELSSQIVLISSQNDKSYDLMQKASTVQFEHATAFKDYLKVPQGRKGVASVEKSMEKAKKHEFVEGDQKIVYSTLLKATQGGDRKAGSILSVYESSGQNINMLSDDKKRYISNLLKEDK